VDILHAQAVTPQAWRVVGHVAADLGGADCLALYHPPLGRWSVCSEETAERLRAKDPIAAVFLEFHQAPVIPIDDDPRLKAAEEEAKRRFPEFDAAFHAKNGDGFAVKAPVSANGNTEHI
jgi:hypothetical protein